MHQIAIFVDAGYLHAQGSALLAGQKQARTQIVLDVDKALSHFKMLSESCAPDARLLRIYWYDGLTRSGRLSSEQEQIANAPFTKLRLGTVNSKGEQKGVDSLIVTDLIDLARNRAISDVVLLSGDEDIRIGVQIAQTFGVRTHLVGIKPARGSQSPDLIQEADTHHEWSAEVLVEIMSILPLPSDTGVLGSNLAPSLTTDDPAVQSFDAKVQLAIDSTLDSVDQKVLDSALLAFKANSSSVPPELDRPTLGHLRALLARDLTDSERKTYRATFRSELAKI